MKKKFKALIIPIGLAAGSSIAFASMGEQLIYNVLGQVTNATGARLGDEIYYGSSRGSQRRGRVHHRKKIRHRKKVHHKEPVVEYKPIVPQMTDEKRIQKALTSLGFYHGSIDGEINSFETRSAIKALNNAYGISSSAILKPEVKDSLIYIGTLFNFDRNLIAKGTDKITKGKKIQTALKIHGFYHTKIDGAIGSGTRRSIAEYKTSQGLSSGSTLDFEEEYQLVSTAKEMNDKNIEDTLASLKSLGTQQYRTATSPATQAYQRTSVAQPLQKGQPVQNSQPVQQSAQLVQNNQPVQQSAQLVQNTQPVQQSAQAVQKAVETVPIAQQTTTASAPSQVPQNTPNTATHSDKK